MHHRAQLLYLLRQLGMEGLPGGDALSWESRATTGEQIYIADTGPATQ